MTFSKKWTTPFEREWTTTERNIERKNQMTRKRILALQAGIIALALLTCPMTVQTASAQCPETYELWDDNNGLADDNFGHAVAIMNSITVVGSPYADVDGTDSGVALLFDIVTGDVITDLIPSDGSSNNEFGNAVSISNTRVVVGAWTDDPNGTDSGSAYLFDTSGTEIAKLVPADNAAGDSFGCSVGVHSDGGHFAVVGACNDNDNGTNSGSAYVFTATSGTELPWKLLASDGAGGDNFGNSIDIFGTTAIVGAWKDDAPGFDSGSAYLFDVTTGNQLFKLTPSDGANFDEFGKSVAIDGTTAIVGAPDDDDNGSDSGSAYLFDTTTGNQLFKLTPGDGASNDYFGFAVAISGDIAIVGAYGDDDNGALSGSVYFFDATTGTELFKEIASDGAFMDHFGQAVGIDVTNIVVGAPLDDDWDSNAGSGYLFSCATSQTVAASYTCTPNNGTVPFSTVMSVSLDNLYTGFTRQIAARINLTLGNGNSISNWKGGYSNVGAGSSYTANWSQSIPAVGSVIGLNTFQLEAEDVTPAPYNQAPHPASGDTATATCTVTGIAP